VSEKQPSSLAIRFSTIGQIFSMLKRTRRWWMIPMLVIMVLVGLALSGLQAVQYVAPFIYAVF
jgi:uncharacterized protein involved in exopolysaccharide biosynthesis